LAYLAVLFFQKKIKISDDTTSCLPTCPLREEKSFSQRAFSIYTDIRKLQDKAKTSYTLSTRRLRFIKDFIYFPDNFAGGVAPPDKVKSEVDTT